MGPWVPLRFAPLAFFLLAGMESIFRVGAGDETRVIWLICEGALVSLAEISGLLHGHISIDECLPQTVVRDAGGAAFVTVELAIFALQALAEEALEEFLASLTDGGPCVAVDEEGVWHLDLGQQHLIQLDGATGVGRGRR